MKPDMKPISPPERERTYEYLNGAIVTLKNVSALCVSPSGNHRLETADGKKHIVMAGFVAIHLDTDEWAF